MTDTTNPLALALVIIGAIMGFGREPLSKFYLWLFNRVRKQEPDARLLAAVQLYLVFTSLIFSVAGVLGLLNIIRF